MQATRGLMLTKASATKTESARNELTTLSIPLFSSLANFPRALAVTFGQSPGRSAIWLLLLIIRALSVPLLVWLTGYIIGMVTGAETLNTGHCILLAVLWLISLTIGNALSPWLGYLMDSIGNDAMTAIQLRLITTLNRIPDITMLENKSYHDDIALAERHLESTPTNFVMQCESTLESLITITALAFLIAQISWIVVIVIMASIIPHACMMNYLAKHNYWNARLSIQEWKEVQYCASSISTSSFAQETRLFGSVNYFANKSDLFFSKLSKILLNAKLKSTSYPIPTLLLQQIGSVIGLLILLRDFQAGLISAAAIVVVLQSLHNIQRKFESGTQTYSYILRNLMYFKSIFRVLDIKPAISISQNPLPINITDPIEIRFHNVCFAYQGGPPVLYNLSFTWKWGENLALVGENGGGKSTIVKLLLRFYDPDSGQIYINNRPIANYDLEQWRRIIAPVFQDFGRYEYTIRENMYFANTNVKTEDTDAILKSCGLSELVDSLPEGIETRLGKRFGTTDLSGGQWQKLAIARALCKPSSIMILDEPTAALDPNIESDIYQLFEKLSDGKSTLMITHRLGSTKMADVILVLSDGHIAESGSHEELTDLNGLYAEMFKAQAEWYERQC